MGILNIAISKLHFDLKFFLKKFSSLRNILRFANRKMEKITIRNFKFILWTKKEFIPLVTVRQKEKPA